MRRGLAADGRPRQRGHRRDQASSAAAAGGRSRRSDPVPGMAGRRQFHAARGARLHHVGRGRRSRSGGAVGSRHPARPRRAGAQARRSGRHSYAGNPRVLRRAEDADHHQGQREVARAPADISRLRRGQALRCGRTADRRAAHRRPVHLDRLHAIDTHHSVSAPQGRCAAAARRLRSRDPFRQGAGQRAGAIRATNCSRSTWTRSTSSP